jgi:hypothetical protein
MPIRKRHKPGNCYVTCEALFHLLGGKKSGWKPMHMRYELGGDWYCSHWFLKHRSGVILDPTVKQFKKKPNYKLGRGCGFLTKHPSKKAKALMPKLLWPENA